MLDDVRLGSKHYCQFKPSSQSCFWHQLFFLYYLQNRSILCLNSILAKPDLRQLNADWIRKVNVSGTLASEPPIALYLNIKQRIISKLWKQPARTYGRSKIDDSGKRGDDAPTDIPADAFPSTSYLSVNNFYSSLRFYIYTRCPGRILVLRTSTCASVIYLRSRTMYFPNISCHKEYVDHIASKYKFRRTYQDECLRQNWIF